jgi:hypothetical protein
MATFSPHIKAMFHVFMPGDTVSGVIKKYNRFDVTKEEMNKLIEDFKESNQHLKAIKPGMSSLIPVLERHQAEVFSH